MAMVLVSKSYLNQWDLITPEISSGPRYSCISSDFLTQENDDSDALGSTPDGYSADNRRPAFRGFSYPVCVNGKLIFFGGGDGDYPGNDVEVYDPATNRWEQNHRPHAIFGGGGGGVEYAYINMAAYPHPPVAGTVEPFTYHCYGRQSRHTGLNRLIGINKWATTVGSGETIYTGPTRNYQYPDGSVFKTCLVAYDHTAGTWSKLAEDVMDCSFCTNYDPNYGGGTGAVFAMKSSGGNTLVQRIDPDGSVHDLDALTGEIVATGSASVYDPTRKVHIIAGLYDLSKLVEYDSAAHSYADITSQLESELADRYAATDGSNFLMAFDTLQNRLMVFSCDLSGSDPSPIDVWSGRFIDGAWSFAKTTRAATCPSIYSYSGIRGFNNSAIGAMRAQYDSVGKCVWILHPRFQSSTQETLYRYH